jgi:hypothetical protein
MTQETAERLSTRLTTQEYRYTAAGIGREVVGERFAAGYKKQLQSHYTEKSGGGSSDEDGEDPLELQNGRSTAVGLVAYAVQADLVQGLSMRSVNVFRTLSHAWHAFLGLASVGSAVGREIGQSKGRSQGKRLLGEEQPCSRESRQESVQESGQESEQKRAKLSALGFQSEAAATAAATLQSQEARSREASLEIAVRKVLSLSPSSLLTYKSPEQKQALDAVVQGISLLIVVLPTGGGKTLLPLAAAVLNDMQQSDRPSVTMLVLPFRALIEDLLVRLG